MPRVRRAVKTPKVPKIDAKGILVFYLNVGHLSPPKAEAFVERMRDRFLSGDNPRNWKIPDDVGVFFLPVRPPQETYIDYICFDGLDEATREVVEETMQKISNLFSETLLSDLISHLPEPSDG